MPQASQRVMDIPKCLESEPGHTHIAVSQVVEEFRGRLSLLSTLDSDSFFFTHSLAFAL